MTEISLTTLTIFRKDKERFNKLYVKINERSRVRDKIPVEKYKLMTKSEFFGLLINLIEEMELDVQ